MAALWDAEREGPDEVFKLTSEIVAVEVTPAWFGLRWSTEILS